MRQSDLFSPFAADLGRQGQLFDEGPRLSSLSCGECGEPLEETPSGWVVCPRGHGRLMPEAPEPNGSWFDE